ncbi:MAG: hypothetical protein OIF55_20130, partial [Amphritea sp.]|nr:hypothetical protein [Amphritea sp.]
ASTLKGALEVTSGGDLTQSGALDVDGAASLTVTNADITLDNSGNDFFSLALNAVNAAIKDSNVLTLAASALTGTLDVTSGGDLTQSGALDVDGAATLAATGDITLANSGNDFNSIAASATNLSVRDTNALIMGAVNVNDLNVTTGGALTQTGAFVVADTASITANTATLTQANNFNTLSLSGGSAEINDVNGIVLGSTDLSGNLTVTAVGNITQSGAVEVDGATSLTATNADITLQNAGNDLSSLSASANNIYLRDANALTVNALNVNNLSLTTGAALTQAGAFIVADTASIDAGSAILTQANDFNTLSLNGGTAQINDVNGVVLGSTDLTGTLIVTAAGDITQSGAISVATVTSLTATNADITLENAANDFNNLSVAANNLRLREVNGLNVGALNVNDLSLVTGGVLSQNGAFVVANTASIDAASATLTQANNFNTLSLKGGSAVVNDINGVVLGSTDLAGNLTVAAAGNITQSGAVEVDGATSLTATNADITLENAANDFNSLAASATNLSVRDTNALNLGALNVNDLRVTTGGALTQSGAFVVANTASFDTDSVTLTLANNFNTLSLKGGSA